jgi:hypothetical protein
MTKREPYDADAFRQMRVLDAWEKYDAVLSWGKGQCLAILDDGCNLNDPAWQVSLPWGKKVIATWNSIDRNDNPAHVPPGYHGTTVGHPSSMNLNGKMGVAYNNFVAHVRCVSVVHLTRDESATIAGALRWVIENHKEYNITTVNLAPVDDQRHREHLPTAIDEPLRHLRELGIWVSAPCANNQFSDGISWPACAEFCFAIGATKPTEDVVWCDRYSNTDLVVPAGATSSSNAYIAAASMILREAIETSRFRWRDHGKHMPEAMMAIFQNTGVPVYDPGNGLHFKRLDLLAALNHVFATGGGQ